MKSTLKMTNLKNKDNIPQCKFFVQRKKRFCRMTVKTGLDYCGEHTPDPENNEAEADKRVPCPFDPKHTCFESKLEKHLSICNARSQAKPAYYEENINAVSEVGPPRSALSTIPQDVVDALIEKINTLYMDVLSSKVALRYDTRIHPAVVQEFNVPGRTESSLRHLRQVSSLLWILEAEGLMHEEYCYVELGAGKGCLSYQVGQASGGRVLAVERASRRYKKDTRLSESKRDRLREDLAHVALERVNIVKESAAIVGIAKHLCGDATDLAIRCMSRAEVSPLTGGLLLATCCHHRCLPRSYVGHKHIQELGISESELNVMLGVVSWATCGIRGNQKNAKSVPARSAEEREQIGRRAKLLLDYGRVLYLRDIGFDACLAQFVDSGVTLENVCIIAKKDIQ